MNTYLGIELGSTRIKAVAIDENFIPLSSGDYTWASSYENGLWTYDLSQAWEGLNQALSTVKARGSIKAAGVSAMMHGYLAFDKDWNLLVPFRTWQNTVTEQAATKLTRLFGFNIPQRWSIAHLYQAVINGEEHISRIAHITTLAGYIHYMLTGVNAVGVGEASGMFPINEAGSGYDAEMMEKFSRLEEIKAMPWKLSELLPGVLSAGDEAGRLTKSGAELLGGLLPEGLPFAPPEGDAGTGMTATNAVSPATGNISAGTSIFSMVVLDRPLKNVYEEIDVVTTPAGKQVAMVHCNNCTNDFNAWTAIFKEAMGLFGCTPSTGDLYTTLYNESLRGDTDCGGVTVCNYLAGESVAGVNEGRPLVARKPESSFTLANFLRAQLYSTMATLRLGMEILEKENVPVKSLTGHGGLFKTPVVGQKYMAAACNAPVTVMETAGEGGPYGMALLAAFSVRKDKSETLEEYLSEVVFKDVSGTTLYPEDADAKGFEAYMKSFKSLLIVEKSAIDSLK